MNNELRTIVCYQDGYEPTPKERAEDEKKIEAFVGYIRMERELKDLKRTFSSSRKYTGQQVKQVIDARLATLRTLGAA